MNKPFFCDLEDLSKPDIRVGTILDAVPFPQARKPAYKLLIDFGEEVGTRRSSAQLTKKYKPDQLIGRQVLAVINFPPKQIGPFMSQCLILGAVEEDRVYLLEPITAVANGSQVK